MVSRSARRWVLRYVALVAVAAAALTQVHIPEDDSTLDDISTCVVLEEAAGRAGSHQLCIRRGQTVQQVCGV
jgi:hypothetical protein